MLVEKPMCITRREADQIVAAQKNSNVLVQVGYMRRYAPAFLEGCEVVKAMKEIKFARVRDFLGSNSLVINPTSRVIRDRAVTGVAQERCPKLRDEALIDEALGGIPSPALRRAYCGHARAKQPRPIRDAGIAGDAEKGAFCGPARRRNIPGGGL